MNRSSYLSKFWQVLILIVVNLLILVGLVYGFEFYLSLTDPRHKLRPDPVETTNRYGFREREFAVPKPDNLCRVMVLGDSFTWGKEVWVEERYTNLTESYLNRAYPDKKFEVLSFGYPGGPTTKERDTLHKYGVEVEPDLVVVGFVINDPQPRRQDYSVERERFEEKYGRHIEEVLEDVEDLHLERTADLIRKALDSFIVKVGLVPSWQDALQRTYEKDSAEWQAFVRALRDIKQMSDMGELPPPIFLVLNQGVYTDRPTDYSHPDPELQRLLAWYHQAEETADRLGYYTINYEQELAEQMPNEILAVHILDLHPSPAMHRLYAQKLAAVITAYLEQGQMCQDDFLPASPEF